MKRQKALIGCLLVMFVCGLGCNTYVTERDGEPVRERANVVMVNPAGHVLSDLDNLIEICYEKVVDPRDSSSVIIGYGKDTHKDNDTAAFYLLASGRYYPMGKAPSGFFINADIGAGHYTYKLTDNTDWTFMYGMTVGYKIMMGDFAFDMGAGMLKTDFEEGEEDFTPILRFQLGMRF
jgi:hypothetical protein